jgi:hypothetical protein
LVLNAPLTIGVLFSWAGSLQVAGSGVLALPSGQMRDLSALQCLTGATLTGLLRIVPGATVNVTGTLVAASRMLTVVSGDPTAAATIGSSSSFASAGVLVLGSGIVVSSGASVSAPAGTINIDGCTILTTTFSAQTIGQ